MGRSYEDRAQKAVEEGTWRALAWSNVANRKFVQLIYDTRASNDPQLALTLQRFRAIRSGEPRSWVFFLGHPQEELAPLFVSALHDDWWHNHLPQLTRRGLDLGEPISPHLQKQESKDLILPLLTASPYQEDRDAAFPYLAKAPEKPRSYRWSNKAQDQLQMAAGYAFQNDERGDEILTQTLETMSAPGYVPEEEDGWELLLDALRHRVESPAAESWLEHLSKSMHRSLDIFVTIKAFFDAGVDGGIKPKLRAFVDRFLDDMPQSRIRRVGFEWLLADEDHPPALDDARWLMTYLYPKPYAWPKKEQWPFVQRLCAELYLLAGTEQEKAWVASCTRSPYEALHEIGDRACRALGLPVASRSFVNRGWIEALVDDDEIDKLLSLVEDEDVIWDSGSHYAAMGGLRAFIEEDQALRERVVKWARQKLENQRNYPAVRSDIAPPDSCYITFLLSALTPEERDTHLGESESLWIRQFCFEERPSYPTPPATHRPEEITVTPMGAVRFTKGNQVNGMTISHTGDRVWLVGDKGGRLLSLPEGEQLATLDASGWGYDCLLTPDDQTLIVCYHGGYLIAHDAKTGAQQRTFQGHPGVPRGVKCVALHHDGDTLVSGDDDGNLFAWSLTSGETLWQLSIKGAFTDALFLPDGRVIASYYHETKRSTKSAIVLVETDGETKRSVKCESAVWSMALHDDGRLALAGDDGYLALGEWQKKRFVEQERHELPGGVTRLVWQGDQLWACTKEGAIGCLEGGHLQLFETKAASFWAMGCAGPMTLAAGSSGQITIIDKGELKEPPPTHKDRVVSVVELSDGTLLSLDRAGHILRWPQGQGPASFLADVVGGAGSLVPFDDDAVVAASRVGLTLLHTRTGEVLSKLEREGSHVDVASAFDDQLAHVTDKTQISFYDLPSLSPSQRPALTFPPTKSLANSSSGTALLAGSENGFLGCWSGGEWQWKRADHGRDGFEKGNPHKTICSTTFSPDGKFAVSGATDDVVRVYDAKDGTPLWRIQCHFGLYNRLSIDPTSQWLAIPDDRALSIIDLKQGSIYATLPAQEFAESPVLTAHFLRDGSLIATNAAGSLFRVVL